MKIAGFSFIRNAIKYDYPIVESIQSILPLVDTYFIAVGNSDDDTRKLIASIPSNKITIIDTIWDETIREGGFVLASETNKVFSIIPQEYDWAFYLQGDEIIHEDDYDNIRSGMHKYLFNKNVDGLLFKYLHFFGSYKYIGTGRRWYRKEIRIIRNDKNIISWKGAQGFRFNSHQKLRVKEINAHIYHYGWVKPPATANLKSLYFLQLHNPDFVVTPELLQNEFDYHHNDRLSIFSGKHPVVMQERVNKQNWSFEFDTTQKGFYKMKLKHKIAHFIEDLTGYRIGEYRNYKK
jgi:hypothetical protein